MTLCLLRLHQLRASPKTGYLCQNRPVSSDRNTTQTGGPGDGKGDSPYSARLGGLEVPQLTQWGIKCSSMQTVAETPTFFRQAERRSVSKLVAALKAARKGRK